MTTHNRVVQLIALLCVTGGLAGPVVVLSRSAQRRQEPRKQVAEVRQSDDADVSAVAVSAKSSFVDGHANFLQTAVQFSYLYGDPDQAEFYYAKLRRLYGKTYPHRFDKSLEDFIHDNMVANMDTYFNALQFVQAMILQALERGLANNRPQVFERFIELAKVAHKKWNDQRDTVILSPEWGGHERQWLLPFDQMLAEVYVGYMNQPGLNPLTRAQLWNATPDDLRRAVFDRVVERARLAATKMNLDPQRAFAEPPGMGAYRKAHPVQEAGQPIQGSAADPRSIVHVQKH